jgi:predicted Rossmann fold flavoprotein
LCAAVAGQRGRRVALLDHGSLPGRKILISGGGRCNFTNIIATRIPLSLQNPHFAKSALASTPRATSSSWSSKYNIPYHEKTLGQLFCDHSAHAILNLLLAECEKGRVEHVPNAHSIQIERDSSGFHINAPRASFAAQSLVIATGGLSIPKLGATSFGYDLARQFGLSVIEPRPALVPLLLGGKESLDRTRRRLDSRASQRQPSPAPKVRSNLPSFVEKLLVTHRGLSGPAILQISSYWKPGSHRRRFRPRSGDSRFVLNRPPRRPNPAQSPARTPAPAPGRASRPSRRPPRLVQRRTRSL